MTTQLTVHWYYTPAAERKALREEGYTSMTECLDALVAYMNDVLLVSGVNLELSTFCASNTGYAFPDVAPPEDSSVFFDTFRDFIQDSDIDLEAVAARHKNNADYIVLLTANGAAGKDTSPCCGPGCDEPKRAEHPPGGGKSVYFTRIVWAPLFPFHVPLHEFGRTLTLEPYNDYVTAQGQPNIMHRHDVRAGHDPHQMFFTNKDVSVTWDGVEVQLGDDSMSTTEVGAWNFVNATRGNDTTTVNNLLAQWGSLYENWGTETDECMPQCPPGEKRWDDYDPAEPKCENTCWDPLNTQNDGNRDTSCNDDWGCLYGTDCEDCGPVKPFADPLPNGSCTPCDNSEGVSRWGSDCTILECETGLDVVTNDVTGRPTCVCLINACTDVPTAEPTTEPTDEPEKQPEKAGAVSHWLADSQWAVGTLSVVTRGQGFAGSQRLLWLMNDCDDAALDDEPRWDVAPIPLAIPTQWAPAGYYTGGAVMALVLLCSVFAAHVTVALVYYCISSIWLAHRRKSTQAVGTCTPAQKKTKGNKKRIKYMSLPKALHDCKVTYSAIAMYAIVAEPIGLLATATLTSGGGWDQRCVALGILVVFCLSGGVVFFLLRSFSCAVQLEPVSAEEQQTKSVIVRLLIPHSLWVVRGGNNEVDAALSTNAAKQTAAGKEVALLKYKEITSPVSHNNIEPMSTWADFDVQGTAQQRDDETNQDENETGDDRAETLPEPKHLWWTCKWAPLFTDFSCRGWYVIEVTISFLLGVTEALTPLFGCNITVGTGFALLLIHTILMCKLRPYLIPCDRYLMIITSPLMTIVAALKLAFVLQKSDTIADVMEFGLVGIGLLLLLRSLLDAFAFVRNLFIHVCFGWTRYRTVMEVKLENKGSQNTEDHQEHVVSADSFSTDRLSQVVSQSDLDRLQRSRPPPAVGTTGITESNVELLGLGGGGLHGHPHQPPTAVGTTGYTESDVELLGLGGVGVHKVETVKGGGTRDVSGPTTEGRSARSFVDAFEAPTTREVGKGSPLMLLSRQHQQKAILNFLDQQHKRNGTRRGDDSKDGDGTVPLSVIPTAENAGVGTKPTSIIEVTADARAVQNAIETMKLTAKGSAPGPSTPAGALAKRDVAIGPTSTHVNPSIPVAAVANGDSLPPQNFPVQDVADVNEFDPYAIL